MGAGRKQLLRTQDFQSCVLFYLVTAPRLSFVTHKLIVTHSRSHVRIRSVPAIGAFQQIDRLHQNPSRTPIRAVDRKTSVREKPAWSWPSVPFMLIHFHDIHSPISSPNPTYRSSTSQRKLEFAVGALPFSLLHPYQIHPASYHIKLIHKFHQRSPFTTLMSNSARLEFPSSLPTQMIPAATASRTA